MTSEIGSSLVLFIAALGVAGIAGAALANVVGEMAVQVGDQGEVMADAIAADIAIVNDPDNVPYDDAQDKLTIYVKNTGSRRLTSEEMTILVDGQHEDFTTRVLGDQDRWAAGVVLEANVTVNLDAGDHEVRASYTPNIADDLEFRV